MSKETDVREAVAAAQGLLDRVSRIENEIAKLDAEIAGGVDTRSTLLRELGGLEAEARIAGRAASARAGELRTKLLEADQGAAVLAATRDELERRAAALLEPLGAAEQAATEAGRAWIAEKLEAFRTEARELGARLQALAARAMALRHLPGASDFEFAFQGWRAHLLELQLLDPEIEPDPAEVKRLRQELGDARLLDVAMTRAREQLVEHVRAIEQRRFEAEGRFPILGSTP